MPTLQKRKNTEKRAKVIKRDTELGEQNQCLEDTEEMLQETKMFYQWLYSEKKTTLCDVKIEDYVCL